MSIEATAQPLPQPSLEYRGTYKFSIVVGGTGRLFLSYGQSTFTTNADDKTTFALYELTHTNPRLVALKAIGGDVAQYGKWLALDGAREPVADDVFPKVVWPSSELGAARFRINVQGGKARLELPDFKAAMTVRGSAPWLVSEKSFYAQEPWTVDVINEWSRDQSGADLRWIDFTKAKILDKGLNDAKLASTDFAYAAVLSSYLRKADFSNAMLYRASFSWAAYGETKWETDLTGAVFKGASLINATFDGCNLTDADFREANVAAEPYPYYMPATFRGATLCNAKFSLRAFLQKVDFSGANLTGATLKDADLQGANFRKANLTGADLSGADLRGADLTDAILLRAKLNSATLDKNTKFLGARMMGADFHSCDLRTAQFSIPPAFYEGTLSPPSETNPCTNLHGATVPLDLIKLDWTWLNADSMILVGTLPLDLTGFKANYTNFPDNYDLKKYKLDNASFVYATMHGAQLQEATTATGKPVDFSHADLTGAAMSFVRLKGVKFVQAWLTGVVMAKAVLDDGDFSGAHLETKDNKSTDLSHSSLKNASFENAHLSGANLTYVLLWGDNAKVNGATVQRTRFDNAYLGKLDFQNVAQQKFLEASFTGACLVNAKFNGAALQDVSFSGACLQGAEFNDASLVRAQMTNAAIWTSDAQGRITISGHDSLPQSLTFQKTKIVPTTTDVTTTCPNGDVGPCSNEKWNGPQAPMTSWKWGPKTSVPDGA